MPVFIALLRAVNVGGHNLIKMDALRKLCESLGLRDPQTYVQSGNVVFQSDERKPAVLAKRIEGGIEKKFKFRPEVIVRSGSDLRQVIATNPFAKRQGIEPNRLLVNFLCEPADAQTRNAIFGLRVGTEEIHIDGREIYMYFPDGIARSKLWPAIGRVLKKPGTARNLNTVKKLLEMAEKLE